MSRRVSIIGAGVAGLTCAAELLQRGFSVTVFERSDQLGSDSCSRYAGGMLAPFCERENAEEQVITLGAQAADWWEGQGVDVTRNGSLVIALGRDRNELKRFAARTREFEEIGPDEIATLEPDLADRFSRALHFRSEAHIDPRKALFQLQSRIEAMGGEIRFGHEQAPDGAPGDHVIDARGYAAREDLDELRGVKGEMLILRCPDIALGRPVRLIHPRSPIYIVPRSDHRFMVGATMIESGERSRISVRSMLELLGAAYALHPAFGEAEILETGCDVRPAFPDNLPRIVRDGRILRLNGLFRHGFLLSPAMASTAADMISKSEDRHVA